MGYRTALTERLIQILFKLVRRSHSRQELAREFDVDGKTIRRDLDVLMREFPIIEQKRGREIFYQYAEGYKFKIPGFSIEEIATLFLAQRAIAGIGITAEGSVYSENADSALAKIKRSLPTMVAAKLEVLADVYGSSQIPEKDFSSQTETIDRLASCAARRRKVRIRYHSLNRDEQTFRILHPLAVYFDPDGATLKLIAYDPKRDRQSVFSVDRIGSVSELDESFRRPAGFTLDKYLEENCFNGIHGEPLTVRLKATGITARIFRERRFHPSQKTVEFKQKRGTSPETITIELHVARGRGLHRFILSHLPNVEVISPLSLRDEIYGILQESLPHYEPKTLTAKM